jgi:hypothetical protein
MRQVLVTSDAALTSATVAIATLDLSMVAQRLSTKGWDEERIAAATSGYKAFLTDVQNGGDLRPESDVDAVWHEHILHTKRYAQDCESIFGAFVHHDPEPAAVDLCVPSVEKPLCVPSVETKALCVASVDTSLPAN